MNVNTCDSIYCPVSIVLSSLLFRVFVLFFSFMSTYQFNIITSFHDISITATSDLSEYGDAVAQLFVLPPRGPRVILSTPM